MKAPVDERGQFVESVDHEADGLEGRLGALDATILPRAAQGKSQPSAQGLQRTGSGEFERRKTAITVFLAFRHIACIFGYYKLLHTIYI